MIIEDERDSAKTKFLYVPLGMCFIDIDGVWMKIQEKSQVNAVNLSDGCTAYYDANEEVSLVKARVAIEKDMAITSTTTGLFAVSKGGNVTQKD